MKITKIDFKNPVIFLKITTAKQDVIKEIITTVFLARILSIT